MSPRPATVRASGKPGIPVRPILRPGARSFLSAVALAFLSILASGCRHVPPPFYPIGIYGVRGTNELAAVRNAGFNAVVGSANQAYLDFAEVAGLKVLASPGTFAGPRFSTQQAQRTVTRFDGHPALWAWYLIDEPDLNGVSPADVRTAHLFVKRLGARKPTALVLYQGGEAEHYANIADITMIDRYPVPWLPLANFPQHLRMARLAVPKGKPLVAVIQAFDWSFFPDLRPSDDPMRPPTYDELRCMTYCALTRGTTGLFYYCYDDGHWRLPDHPEVWTGLQKVVAEVRERLPLFEAEHLWWPFVHRFPGHPTRGFNLALESSVNAALVRVSQGNSAIPNGTYLVTVNNTDAPLTYQITVPPLQGSEVPVLGEGRAVPVLDAWLQDQFAPFEVHIYGPLPLR